MKTLFKAFQGSPILSTLAALLWLAPLAAQAQDVWDYTYATNNGTITITRYIGPYADVVIPFMVFDMPVTAIGACAFSNCYYLSSVSIPFSITNLGDAAFYGCTSLGSVTIPEGVPSLGYAAFANCDLLTSVTLPNSVTHLGDYAFFFCYSLPSINFPTNLASIGSDVFYYCAALTSVSLPASVTNIGKSAFAGCARLSAITVDGSNPSFSSVAGVLFDKGGTRLIQCPGGKTGTYAIPTGVTTIGWLAFVGCYTLAGVTIPDTVTTIEDSVFTDCYSLTSVVIPNSVTCLSNFVFSYCGSLASVTLPNSLTNIGVFVFAGCSSLARITIPAAVVRIDGYAFQNCASLTEVYFQGNAPPEVNNFAGANKAIVYYLPGTTGWGPIFDGRPTALWNPQAQTSSPTFGVGTNGFGFTITGTPNIPIVVEACASLGSGTWVALKSCMLTNGSLYFSDPQWTNHPANFYRIRSP